MTAGVRAVDSGAVDFGTAIRATRIRVAPQGPWIWTRTAPDPAHPFSALPVVPFTSSSGHRVVVGDGDDVVRRYRLPARHTLAVSDHDWMTTVGQWAEVLAELHRLPVVSGSDTDPPARTRLRSWWSEPDLGDRRRNAGRAAVLDGLDRRVRDRLDDILTVDLSIGGRLVHGWADIGYSVADPDGRLVVMAGEDAGCAPLEFDLGALVAQFTTHAVSSPVQSAMVPSRLTRALVTQYTASGGSDVDPQALDDFTLETLVRNIADRTWFTSYDDVEVVRCIAVVNGIGSRH